MGLRAALVFLIERLENDLGLEIDYQLANDYPRQDPLVETVFFRTAQEAMINSARHAETNKVSIILEKKNDVLQLIVQDYGKGFDLSSQEWAAKGLGLIGMQERVESLGGNFSITSGIGQGTVVIVEFLIDSSYKEEEK